MTMLGWKENILNKLNDLNYQMTDDDYASMIEFLKCNQDKYQDDVEYVEKAFIMRMVTVERMHSEMDIIKKIIKQE